MSDHRSVDINGVDTMIKIHFGSRVYIGLSELATLIGVSTKTLKRHIDLGNIRFSKMGHGCSEVRRAFTADDVVDFFERVSVVGTTGRTIRDRTR